MCFNRENEIEEGEESRVKDVIRRRVWNDDGCDETNTCSRIFEKKCQVRVGHQELGSNRLCAALSEYNEVVIPAQHPN